MRAKVALAVGCAALLFLVLAPVVSVSAGGQYFVLGEPVTPSPTGQCASWGCHCALDGSMLGLLVGIGYRRFLGCP